MAWSRFEPGFSRHPKRIKGGVIASWLWVCSVDHCTEFRTNGFLDEAAVPGLAPPIKAPELAKAVKKLLDLRSWEAVVGGYLVHGYLEHNPTAEQVEADRASARERYRKWKEKKTETGSKGQGGNGVTNEDSKRRSNDVAATPTVGRSVGQSSITPPTPPATQGASNGEDRRPYARKIRGEWYGLVDGEWHFGGFMLHKTCEAGRRGLCLKTEYLDLVPPDQRRQCPEHRAGT